MLTQLGLTTFASSNSNKGDGLPCNGPCCLCGIFLLLILQIIMTAQILSIGGDGKTCTWKNSTLFCTLCMDTLYHWSNIRVPTQFQTWNPLTFTDCVRHYSLTRRRCKY